MFDPPIDASATVVSLRHARATQASILVVFRENVVNSRHHGVNSRAEPVEPSIANLVPFADITAARKNATMGLKCQIMERSRLGLLGRGRSG